jgi:predicted transcriptional regulator
MADITVTAANVLGAAGHTTATKLAGETITAGQALYLKASDGRVWKAQADGTAAEATAVGIALNGGVAGQPITYCTAGPINIGGTTAQLIVYAVSATAGGVADLADITTTGHYISLLGYATTVSGGFVVNIVNTGTTKLA